MILYQNDYILVDVQGVKREAYQGEDFGNPETRELIFDLTIQCNGKIRRNRFTIRLNKHDEGCGSTDAVDGWYIGEYRLIYSPFELLKDLGYDVPTGVEWHPIIRDTLEKLF